LQVKMEEIVNTSALNVVQKYGIDDRLLILNLKETINLLFYQILKSKFCHYSISIP
jgi:hypothetical protein